MDLRRRCGGDASVNANAKDNDDYNDDGSNGNNGGGGRDLALALAQPHPHPRDGEGDRDASPPSWRLALDVETFDGLARSMKTRGSSHIVYAPTMSRRYTKTGPPGEDGGGDDSKLRDEDK